MMTTNGGKERSKSTDTSLKMYSSKSIFKLLKKEQLLIKNYLITVKWVFVIRYFTRLEFYLLYIFSIK